MAAGIVLVAAVLVAAMAARLRGGGGGGCMDRLLIRLFFVLVVMVMVVVFRLLRLLMAAVVVMMMVGFLRGGGVGALLVAGFVGRHLTVCDWAGRCWWQLAVPVQEVCGGAGKRMRSVEDVLCFRGVERECDASEAQSEVRPEERRRGR